MTALQSWLTKPRASVRINTSIRWASWINVLRLFSPGRRESARARLEVLDRLSLGGKKSLLLVSIEGRRLLVGVGDGAAPSIARLDGGRSFNAGSRRLQAIRAPRSRRILGL